MGAWIRGRTFMPLTERQIAAFEAKFERRDPDQCWPWTASKNKGYGQFNVGRRTVSSYRVSYELYVGPVPDGLELDHTCHSQDLSNCPGGPACPHRSCVNPSHLEPVTHQINTHRGQSIAGKAARRGTCVNGHPYTKENTRIEQATGNRTCRRCKRDRERERLAAEYGSDLRGLGPITADDPILKALIAERQRRGLSLRAIADQCGVTPGAVSAWERGSRTEPLRFMRAWADQLGFEIVLEARTYVQQGDLL